MKRRRRISCTPTKEEVLRLVSGIWDCHDEIPSHEQDDDIIDTKRSGCAGGDEYDSSTSSTIAHRLQRQHPNFASVNEIVDQQPSYRRNLCVSWTLVRKRKAWHYLC